MIQFLEITLYGDFIVKTLPHLFSPLPSKSNLFTTFYIFSFILSVTFSNNADARRPTEFSKHVKDLKQIIGDKNNNRLYGNQQTLVFGLKGDDKLFSRSGTFDFFSGGRGSDTYTLNGSSIAIIMDNSSAGKDTFSSKSMSWTETNRYETFFATFDKRHLVIISGKRSRIAKNGKFRAGAIFLDWKKKKNRIETLKFRDKTRSGGYLRRNIKRSRNWLGNVSYDELEGVSLGEKRQFKKDLKYLQKRERSLSRRRYSLTDNVIISRYESDKISSSNEGFGATMPSLEYKFSESKAIQLGSTFNTSKYFDASQMLGVSSQYSSDSQFLNYEELDGFMANLNYELNQNITANISWFTQPTDITDLSTQSTLVEGHAISMTYQGESFSLGLLAANELENSTVFGNLLERNWLKFHGGDSSKLGVKANYSPTDNVTLSAWYQYGVGDVELGFSPFLSQPEAIAAYGWGIMLESEDTLLFDGQWSIGITEPYALKRAKSYYSLPELLGESGYYVPLVSSAQEIDFTMNYEKQFKHFKMNTFVKYSQNPNKVADTHDTELLFQFSFPY